MKRVMLVVSMGIMILAFQNCSKVAVQDLGLSSQEKAIGIEAGAGSEVDMGPIVSAPIEEDKDRAPAVEDKEKEADKDKEVVAGTDKDKEVVAGTDKDKDKDKDCDERKKEKEELEARQICERAKSKVVLEDPDKIEHLNGSMVASATHISLINDYEGKLVVVASRSGATIDLISSVRGKLILCGVQVKEARDLRGRLILVDSEILKMSEVIEDEKLADRADDMDKTEKMKQAEKEEKAEKSERVERADRSEKKEKAEKSI